MRFIVVAAIALSLSACTPSETVSVGDNVVLIKADEGLCSAQPDFPSCNSKKGDPAYVRLAPIIKFWDNRVREGFNYQLDSVRYGDVEVWRSHSFRVINHAPWQGDCDDLASTALDMLAKDGFQRKYMWRLLVNTEGEDETNHMVGLVEDIDGNKWVVGDTNRPAYPYSEMKYRVLYYNQLSSGVNWYKYE